MSSTTADGAEVLAMDKASHPSLAWRTSKPSRLSIATAVSRRSSSSSTIRTRGTEAGLSPANPCLPRDGRNRCSRYTEKTDSGGAPRENQTTEGSGGRRRAGGRSAGRRRPVRQEHGNDRRGRFDGRILDGQGVIPDQRRRSVHLHPAPRRLEMKGAADRERCERVEENAHQ